MKKDIHLPNKGPKASQVEKKQYKSIMELLMFLIVETQLDIAFVTFVVSRFTKNLSHQYIEVIKTIIQYFKAMYTLNTIYRKDIRDLIIKNFLNSD